jgi:hypothetical protein
VACAPPCFNRHSLDRGQLLFVGVLVYGTYGEVSTIVDDVPEYADRIRDAIKPLSQGIEKVQKSAGAIATTSSAPPRRVQEVYVSDAPTCWAQMSQQKVTQAIPFLCKRFRVAPKDVAAKD